MSDGDALKSFLYEIGFINDPAGAAKVEAQAKQTEARLAATAEAGAAKRVAIEEAAGAKTKSTIERLLDERAAAEAASLERRKAAARTVLLEMLGFEEDAAGKITKRHKENAGKAVEVDREQAKKAREIRATQMKELEAGLLRFTSVVQAVGTGLSGALAAAPFGAFMIGVERTAEGLSRMAVQAQRVGSSVAGIERFKFALRQQGVDEGEAAGALEGFASKMKSNPEGYRQALARLGVKTMGADGKALGYDAMLENFGSYLATQPFNIARIQAGQFGVSGDNAINALRDPAGTRKGLDAYDRKLSGFGYDPDKAAADARKVDQAYSNLEADLKVINTKLQAEFFVPMLGFFDTLTRKMEENPEKTEQFFRGLEAVALATSARILPVLTNLAVKAAGLAPILGASLGTAVGIAVNPVVALGASAESTPGAGVPADAAERAKVAEENKRLTDEANRKQGSTGSFWQDSLNYIKGKLGLGDDAKVKSDIASTAEATKKLADASDRASMLGGVTASSGGLGGTGHHADGSSSPGATLRDRGADHRTFWQRHAPKALGGRDAPHVRGGGGRPDASLPAGPVPGANGGGLKNAYWRGPLDGKGEGGHLSPRELFSYLKSRGATDNEALMLTGAASSESSFNPEANHDPAYPGGPPTGHGLWGHKHKRIDMRGMTWQQQADAALAEAKAKYAGRINAARTPEELADAEMYYEGPAGFKPGNPRAGDNYMGRLNSIRRFSAMTGHPAATGTSGPAITDAEVFAARQRLAAGGRDPRDVALRDRYLAQQNTPRPGHPDDDRVSRARTSDVPYAARGHLSPVQFTHSDGRNSLFDLHKEGWLGKPLPVEVKKPLPGLGDFSKLHETIQRMHKDGSLANLTRLHLSQLVSSHVLNSIRHGDRTSSFNREGDTFHVHARDAKSGLEEAHKLSARRDAQDRIRYMQGNQQ